MEKSPTPSTPPGTRPFRVLGIGTACLDYLVSVPAYPEENSQVYATALNVQGGGNCGNTLVGLARLGIETAMVTRIGADDTGREIRRSLETEGVGTKYVLEAGNRSPVSFVLVSRHGRTRTVIHRKGIDYAVPLPFDPAWLEGVDLVYLGGRFDVEPKVAEKAKDRGIKVVVEAEHTGTGAHRLFPYADAVIVARNFHQGYFGSEDVEKNLARITARGPKHAAATLGGRGAVLLAHGKVFSAGAVPVKVVDTTGAGDAFAAGFIYGLLHAFDPKQLLGFSQQVAAWKCRHPGAREGLPYFKKAKQTLGELALGNSPPG